MIDVAYVEELKAIEDLKESKAALVEYAKGFGITVKKNQSFDKMVDDIKAQLEELANEPMPEQNEGVSIADLIQAADEKDGKTAFNEASETATQLLVDSPVEDKIKVQEIVDSWVEPVQQIDTGVSIETIEETGTYVVEQTPHNEPEPVKVETFKLRDNYSPSLIMLGSGSHAYVTLPWWIYEWITKNPEWKTNPHSFPHHYGIDTLLSLIYFIQRDGYVRIRETRNSSFVILE